MAADALEVLLNVQSRDVEAEVERLLAFAPWRRGDHAVPIQDSRCESPLSTPANRDSEQPVMFIDLHRISAT